MELNFFYDRTWYRSRKLIFKGMLHRFYSQLRSSLELLYLACKNTVKVSAVAKDVSKVWKITPMTSWCRLFFGEAFARRRWLSKKMPSSRIMGSCSFGFWRLQSPWMSLISTFYSISGLMSPSALWEHSAEVVECIFNCIGLLNSIALMACFVL